MLNDKKDSDEVKGANERVVKYWLNAISRAEKKIPFDKWEIAENRLNAKCNTENTDADERPVVNDFRNHFEGSKAYLDQRDPSFKILPSAAYSKDLNVIKQAECERTYLERVWLEQECQIAQSQKLDSSLIRNVGFTMPFFDKKKWMPCLKYIPAKDVRIDPDCGGIWEKQSWQAYKEEISVEQLKADSPQITKDDIALLKQKNDSTLTEDELKDTAEGDKELYTCVTVWHVFARNDAAVRMYESDDSEEKLPGPELRQALKMDTKRRYLKIVDGIKRPLANMDKWPFDLDHSEMPITLLQMNKSPESMYGFTDYEQMVRMDEMGDRVMSYVESDAYFSSIRKYLASKGVELPSDISIEDFINNNRRSVLLDMLDEAGNPLLKEMTVGTINTSLPGHYELMEKQAKIASGQNELQVESMADFKDVTAIGVRYQEQKLHQRVNLRLSGPRGYEKSIQQDAVKMLEIAHQMVPKYSVVSQIQQVEEPNEETQMMELIEREVPVDMKWEDAKAALVNGGKLIKLGVDAIVGPDLAEYWTTNEETPIEEIRLSTKISVVPGSTRTITQQQEAADLENFYNNILFPTIYQPMMRMDLAVRFTDRIGKLKGINDMEDYLPQASEVAEFIQQTKAAQQAEAQAQQQAGQQDMAAEAERAQIDQAREDAKTEAELLKESAKAEMEMEKEVQKAEIENAKAEKGLEIMDRKAQIDERSAQMKARQQNAPVRV